MIPLETETTLRLTPDRWEPGDRVHYGVVEWTAPGAVKTRVMIENYGEFLIPNSFVYEVARSEA